jgi:dihydropteroate synthase
VASLSAGDAARYSVRPLLPGPLEALRQAVIDLRPGGDIAVLARHGTAEAFAVRGLAPDQARVLERELSRLGGAALTSGDGARAVLLGPLSAFGTLPTRLIEWGHRTESLGLALREALSGKGAWPPPVSAGSHRLDFTRRTLVMGVVNVTPDSFSGDGLGGDVSGAVDLGVAMAEAGADIIDVGGESTRPGSTPVPAEVEMTRVLPVVRELAAGLPVPVSVDTRKATVAAAAVAAGAGIVNDIWGLRGDPEMAGVVAAGSVALVVMHNAPAPDYGDVVADVCDGLRASLEVAATAGIDAARIIVDPGLGFAKTPAHNLELIRRLGELRGLGRPILVGASRKSTVGVLLDGAPPQQRLEGSLALAVLCASAGAAIIRAHDVAETVRVLRVSDAVLRGTPAAVLRLPPPGKTG